MKNRINSWMAVLAKSSKFAKLVKVTKAMKSMKVFVSAISMLVSVAVYALSFGWLFGVGLVAVLFVHEMGHVVECRRTGVKASLPMFIPFLGAAIFIPEAGDRHTEARLGIGGPAWGAASAVACWLVFVATGWKFMLAMSYLAVSLNLFNLIPLRPLDGGRVLQASSEKFVYVGVAALLALTLAAKDAGLILVWILVLQDFAMPRLSKAVYATVLFCAMVVFFFFFDSTKDPPILQCFDLTAGILFVFIYWITLDQPVEQPDKSRPALEPRLRMAWGAGYLALAAFLLLIGWFQRSQVVALVGGAK